MYCGTNPSALKSREWIRNALLELLKERKYAQITIKDICKKADLSRQTFYQIYVSKDEVMEYHFKELFLEFKEQCGNFYGITIKDIARTFFEFFYHHRVLVQELFDNNLSYFLEKQFELFLPQIDLFRELSAVEPYPEYSVAYVAGALTQVLIHWFQSGFDLSVEEMGTVTEGIITGKNIGNGIVAARRP
ncbi:MAG: TetR/AcrR family transcriptional regulator [Muribaculaceae bacterium]|nr:TetR/AcrR family transcriptional regulator [Muribaculaceae bacterium]